MKPLALLIPLLLSACATAPRPVPTTRPAGRLPEVTHYRFEFEDGSVIERDVRRDRSVGRHNEGEQLMIGHADAIWTEAAIAACRTEAQRYGRLETGGVLLGRRADARVIVEHAIGPGPRAAHGPFGFSPDCDWQERQIAEMWRADQSLEYLGDWHTHPFSSPALSELDMQTLKKIADAPDARQPRPIMAIFSGEMKTPTTYEWSGA